MNQKKNSKMQSKPKKKFQNKFPKQIYKEKIKKQRAQYREKYMEEMSKELNPASRTLKDIFELDDEEVKHRQFLEANYRDRAKERRDGKFGEFVEEKEELELFEVDDDIEPVVTVQQLKEQPEQIEVKKGLDMDMYITEMKQLEETSNLVNKKVKKNEFENRKREPVRKKGILACSIERVLHQRDENTNLFKPNVYYEYEIDNIFDQTMPKCIVKKQTKFLSFMHFHIFKELKKRITESFLKLIAIQQNGQRHLLSESKMDGLSKQRVYYKVFVIILIEEINKMEIEVPKEPEQEEIDKTDEDAIFSENEDNQFEKIKSWLDVQEQIPSDQLKPQNESTKPSVFANLTSNPKYSHPLEGDAENSEMNSETMNQIKSIQKSVMLQSKSRLEEKLAELDSEQYMECYPTADPSLSQLKEAGGLAANYRFKRFSTSSKKHGKQPPKVNKAKEFSKFYRVNQIVKDKQNKDK